MAEAERASLTGAKNSDPPLPVLQLIRQLQQLKPVDDELIAVPDETYRQVIEWMTWNFNNTGMPKWMPQRIERPDFDDYEHCLLCGHAITPSPLAPDAA